MSIKVRLPNGVECWFQADELNETAVGALAPIEHCDEEGELRSDSWWRPGLKARPRPQRPGAGASTREQADSAVGANGASHSTVPAQASPDGPGSSASWYALRNGA